MTRLVQGVGTNDSNYNVQIFENGKMVWTCPFYLKWKNMLTRCYGKRHLNPSYDGCIVDNEWLTFSRFREWMNSQKWEGMTLDKDLLGDGLLYSDKTCCFIPNELNIFISSTNKKKAKTDLPTGVFNNRNSGTFLVQCYDPTGFYKKHVGTFGTVGEAKTAYSTRKKQIAIRLCERIENPIVLDVFRRKYA